MKLAIFLLVLPLLAQQPTTLILGGISASPSTRPAPTGFLAAATLISAKTQAWSYSEVDFTSTPSHKAIQSSFRTGAATPLRVMGTTTLWAVLDGGISTVGTASGGAFAGGLIAVTQTKHGSAVLGWRRIITAVAGTQDVVVLGWGWGR